jgi:predicted ATPase/DNA-binding winged helix-turn-helix (wHTH) protein
MGNEKLIRFDPFCLDLANEQLWRGSQEIKLRPKAFAVLDHLLGRPGQLVTKEDLLNAVWPETFVTDAVLKVTIQQLREALGDDPKSPRFIETAHRRGYRFVAEIEIDPAPADVPPRSEARPALADPRTHTIDSPTVVGRDKAWTLMQGWLGKVLAGERQIVFVTGEPGIGKTALVDAFVGSLAADRNIRVGRGQCLEQYGTGEAYLPVLEAIGRLCHGQQQVVDVLRTHAPMWLLQMPSLLSAEDRALLSRDVVGASRERMLREISGALEALTADHPLVLVLEDLHWSDYSTLDLISYLANQRQTAHLMLIGTFRHADLIVSGHPLKAVKGELLAKQQCVELPLEYLNEDAVASYLAARFSGHRFPPALAQMIHERTDGNALFMVNVVDYLLAAGVLRAAGESWELAVEIENVDVGVPDSIKQMIEKQLDHLDAVEQRILEAASVAGADFSTAAVAAALEGNRDSIEQRCENLARNGQFIQDVGVHVLPSGDAISRYTFTHDLYRKFLYERVPPSRRVQLHRRLGQQGAEIHGERDREIAGELAMHFERGAEPGPAAKYLQIAADTAIRRFAYQEAVALSRRGLKLLAKVPESTERTEQELCLHLTLGVPLIATQGYAAPEVGRVYTSARELARQLGEPPDVSEVLWGLWTFHTLKGELSTARKIAEELLRLAQRYPEMSMRGHWAMEITFVHLGEFAPAIEHYEKARHSYDQREHLDDGFFYAPVPGVAMLCFAAWALWFLGRPDQALDRINEALAQARELSEPLSLAHAHLFASVLHQFRREESLALEHADAGLTVANEHGLALYPAMAFVMRGWALVNQGPREAAIQEIRDGLAALKVTGAELVRPHYLGLLGEALRNAGRPEEGHRALDEALALVQQTGEGYYEAELYRLKGEALLPAAAAEAETYFDRSLKIAQRQKAKSCELRTVTSLARLRQEQGKANEARELLSTVYGSFTEGFGTADLLDAKALLDRL